MAGETKTVNVARDSERARPLRASEEAPLVLSPEGKRFRVDATVPGDSYPRPTCPS
jgi:hypothetical protein